MYVCACVLKGLFHYWLTRIVQIFYDHFKAAVTINLGMVSKCVMVGCVFGNVFGREVKNVHSGEQKWFDRSCFQLMCCCEHSTAETGISTQMAVDECIVSCSPDGC